MTEVQDIKGTILVVDDTPAVINMVLSALEEEGCLVMVATNGKQALERVEMLKPDLILMDILMPGMDGYETCRRFKRSEKTADIPVIFMSALHDTPDKVKGFRIGAVDYITKPIEIEELKVRVNTHLTIGRLQTRLRDVNASLEEQVRTRTRELQKVNRMLKMLSASNQSLVRCENEKSFLDEVCRVIVEIGGRPLVWIGLAGRGADKSVRPAAWRGFKEGYPEKPGVFPVDDDPGEGPAGAAIGERKYRIVKDMMREDSPASWREAALAHGCRSCIVLPLRANGEDLGALNIYAREPDAFHEDEIHLLTELADDLAFGVASFRIRRERDRSLEEIQLSKTLLEISNRHGQLPPLLEEYARELQKALGLDAVGVLLPGKEGGPPCQAHAGIGKEFLGAEPLLPDGRARGLYKKVIQGETDPGRPFFTDSGSFFINGAAAFLAGLSEEEKRDFAAVVGARGWESAAMVPIKVEDRILGVIQLADRRDDGAPLNRVKFIERLAAELGPNIQRVWAETGLKRSEERFRTIFQHGAIGICL
ncbi:MAG: response regulator, partial [Desulfobacterales bacterium]|nr:response regulator [Desulfobacterales bacterium]